MDHLAGRRPRAGAFGFNSVLVAIALGTVFLGSKRTTIGYAVMSVIVTPFVVAALAAALEPLGLPALTLPFVLVTWAFVLAYRRFEVAWAFRPTAMDFAGKDHPEGCVSAAPHAKPLSRRSAARGEGRRAAS